MSDYQKVKSELAKLRNGKKVSSVVVRPYKQHKQNIIWLLSLTKHEVDHIGMAKQLGLSGNQVKNMMLKITKSSHALKYIKKYKKKSSGKKNFYMSIIPEHTDINQFVNDVNKTIDMSIVEKNPTFTERLLSLKINIPYEHGFHCLISFLQNAGSRGLTKKELLNSFEINEKHIELEPDILEHGESFIKCDIANWRKSILTQMISTRIFNNETYYFLTQGFDLDPKLFTALSYGNFTPENYMNGKSKCSTTQLHDKKTSICIKNDITKRKKQKVS